MKKQALMFIVPVAVAGIFIGGYVLYNTILSGAFDDRLQEALQSVQDPRSYEMLVETETQVSDRTINIAGLYRLDFEQRRFGSYATTTLIAPELPPKERTNSFTLENVAVGTDVYVKIETESALLRKTIPHSPEWRHFTDTTIPRQFTNIAVSGPVLDSLALLGGNGSYLSLMQKPTEIRIGSSTYHVYTFRLSKKARSVVGGTLQSLMGRIATGTVDVLVDDARSVRGLVVHGDNYVSTTTIMSVNTPVLIPIPSESE